MTPSYVEARARVIETVAELVARRPSARWAAERVLLDEAAGRVLAEDVLADRDQPPFDRVTRDGFAVRAADVAAPPAVLRVAGELAAGAAWEGVLTPGTCVSIMTGAPLPRGADAVVMVEDSATAGPGTIELRRAVQPGENVVPAGSELREGAAALLRGAAIDPAALALLAAVGRAEVGVARRPVVAILGTGDEIVEVEAAPRPTQIRNSNAHALAAQVARAGGAPLRLPIAPDEATALRALVERGLAEADVLVLSGGVSMGKFDLVEPVLAELGAHVVWDAVAIRPGKPAVFGVIPTTGGDRPFFGLPGNPLSTMLTFELFVRPAIALLLGAPAAPLPLLSAPLAVPWRGRPLPLTLFLPAVLEGERDATTVRPLATQGSGDLAALARADVWAIVAPGVGELDAGERLHVLPR